MRCCLLLPLTILAAACTSPPVANEAAVVPISVASPEIEAGRSLAEQKCSACHAVGPGGHGGVPEAPAFRTLSQKYAGSSLKEVLTEGIAAGHPSMPGWIFSPEEASALLAYVRSLQSDDGI